MHRIYLVLSVLWIIAVAVVAISGRPTMPITDWQDVIIGASAPPNKPAQIDDVLKDPDFQKQPFQVRLDFLRRTYSEFAELSPKDQSRLLGKTEHDAVALGGTKVPDPFEQAAREWREGHSVWESATAQTLPKYWETRTAFAIVPPIFGYLVLFGLLPWIGRGFRPT